MIDNQPSNSAFEHILLSSPDETFRAAKAHWIQVIRLNPGNVVILNHAAQCCRIPSPKDARKFWLMAQTLDPLNEEWPLALSNSFNLAACDPHRQGDRIVALKALAYGKRALELHERFPKNSYLEMYTEMILSQMISTALLFGFGDHVRFLGEYLVRQGRKEPMPHQRKQWFDCLAHTGYAALGRIALQEGDRNLAKSYLSKMLLFGDPDWRYDLLLAQALLDSKEVSSVLAYLEGCAANLRKRQQDYQINGASPNELPISISMDYGSSGAEMGFNAFVCARLENKIEQLVKWQEQVASRKKCRLPGFI